MPALNRDTSALLLIDFQSRLMLANRRDQRNKLCNLVLCQQAYLQVQFCTLRIRSGHSVLAD